MCYFLINYIFLFFKNPANFATNKYVKAGIREADVFS